MLACVVLAHAVGSLYLGCEHMLGAGEKLGGCHAGFLCLKHVAAVCAYGVCRLGGVESQTVEHSLACVLGDEQCALGGVELGALFHVMASPS